MTTITVFGASITHGAWDRKLGGWVNRLRLYFDNSDKDFTVYNRAIDGETTVGLLRHFEVDCKSTEPDIIIVDMGTNDSAFLKTKENLVSFGDSERNFNEIIQKSKKFTDKIIIVGLTKVDEKRTMPVSWDKNIFYNNENIKRYDSIIKKVCEQNKILFIEMFALLDEKLLDDGIHPTAKGHEKMFQRVKEFLIKSKLV